MDILKMLRKINCRTLLFIKVVAMKFKAKFKHFFLEISVTVEKTMGKFTQAIT